MTRKIYTLTWFIYGFFSAMVRRFPDIIDAFMNLREEWIIVIVYLAWVALFIFFVVVRHKAIRELDESASFHFLFKREMIVALILTIATLIAWTSIITLFIELYQIYWVCKNYYTFIQNH